MATTTKPDPKKPGSAQRTTPRPTPKSSTSQPARSKASGSAESPALSKKTSSSSSTSTSRKGSGGGGSGSTSTSSSKPTSSSRRTSSSSPSKSNSPKNALQSKSGGSGSGPIHNIKVAIHTAPVDNSKPGQGTLGTGPQFGGPPPQGQTLGPVGPAPGLNMPTSNPVGGSTIGGNGTPGLPGASATTGQGALATPKKPKPLPKSPPKEPQMTPEVKGQRKRKTAVLKERQNREVQGKMRGGPRDVDAGAGFWPPLSPLL